MDKLSTLFQRIKNFYSQYLHENELPSPLFEWLNFCLLILRTRFYTCATPNRGQMHTRKSGNVLVHFEVHFLLKLFNNYSLCLFPKLQDEDFSLASDLRCQISVHPACPSFCIYGGVLINLWPAIKKSL